MSKHRWFFSILLAGALCIESAQSEAACFNQIVSETFSPNGRLKAVLFVRNCGTARNAHLSILPISGVLPAEPGNTFIGEGGLNPSDEEDGLRVKITWLSDAELSILHGVIRRVRYEPGVHGVKVFYGHLVDLPPGKSLK